ncbi:MAG: hypothetical protein AVDCRST_MAG30-2544 [uncultured Solirubrobacteraceae bacterium]|uniref:Uncharacterized protein n=1 Tax=uncultured Solirubrobacteraceae bacterium TaxID=1162706 RepID=A0A6J4T2V7_9ACTN|nr:MAG: hypothetical protein AVDCRST_MAG30-2544 [uncultured Solirubrobacteraceae bacterium]
MDPIGIARWTDVILVLAVAPFVVLMDLPVLGYAAGAAAWVVSRVIGHFVERRGRASGDMRTMAGLTLISSMGRAWLVGLTILAVGLAGEREDGLTAALLVLGAFTLYLIVTIALRPLERKPSNP